MTTSLSSADTRASATMYALIMAGRFVAVPSYTAGIRNPVVGNIGFLHHRRE